MRIVPFGVGFYVLLCCRYKPEIGDIIIGRVIEVKYALGCRHYENVLTVSVQIDDLLQCDIVLEVLIIFQFPNNVKKSHHPVYAVSVVDQI